MMVSALDFDSRSSTLDRLLPLARRAFAMTSEEVAEEGQIRTPFMMTLGEDGFDMGRLHTDRPLELLASSVKQHGRPGVVAFTEGARVVLGLVDSTGVLARVHVPFVGRVFETPVSVDVDEVFDPRYAAPRVTSNLLPLQAPAPTSGQAPDPLAGLAASALGDLLTLAQQSQTDQLFAPVDAQSMIEAPQGLLGAWLYLLNLLERSDAEATAAYLAALRGVESPILSGLMQRVDASDAEKVAELVDPVVRLQSMGALRIVFHKVAGGDAARGELVSVLRSTLEAHGGIDDAGQKALDQVRDQLDLSRSIRMLGQLVVFGLLLLCVLGALGLGGLVWLFG